MSSQPQPTKDGPMGPCSTPAPNDGEFTQAESLTRESGVAREASIGPADAEAMPKRKSNRAKPDGEDDSSEDDRGETDRRDADRNTPDPFAPDGEPRPSRFHVPG